MICLVGEQPVPNLLPVRHLKPDSVLLVFTERTAPVAASIRALLPQGCRVSDVQVDAFDIVAAAHQLREATTNVAESQTLVVNITGGTKPMSLAAFAVARERSAPLIYAESRRGEVVLWRYSWQGAEITGPSAETIAASLTIHEYLVAHGHRRYTLERSVQPFEVAVAETLTPAVDELMTNVRLGQLEMDAILRRGAGVAIAEIKSGGEARKKVGIDQLSTATQREFLGTYTGRLLILDQPMPSRNRALAAAHGIRVVEMAHPWSGGLHGADRSRLLGALDSVLGVR